MLASDNIALVTCRQSAVPSWEHVFVADAIVDDSYVTNRTKERGYCLPLYLYPEEQDLDQTRRINLDRKLWSELKKRVKHSAHGAPDELAVFDYIYGVLHCTAYRETYAEFLKADFPRIPWPTTPDEFWTVADAGGQLRRLHLMKPADIGDAPYLFMGEGDNIAGKARFADDKVWINETQYFDNSPKVSWTFCIGGYQPAQKWLKDRKGCALSFTDVKHYQRIIKILSETDRIMQTITLDLPAPSESG